MPVSSSVFFALSRGILTASNGFKVVVTVGKTGNCRLEASRSFDELETVYLDCGSAMFGGVLYCNAEVCKVVQYQGHQVPCVKSASKSAAVVGFVRILAVIRLGGGDRLSLAAASASRSLLLWSWTALL